MHVSIYLFHASLYIHDMNNAVYDNQQADQEQRVSEHPSGKQIIRMASLASTISAASPDKIALEKVYRLRFYILPDKPQALISSSPPPPTPPMDALCLILMNCFTLVRPSLLPADSPLLALLQFGKPGQAEKENQSTHLSVSSQPGALRAKTKILTKCLLAILLSCPGLQLAK